MIINKSTREEQKLKEQKKKNTNEKMGVPFSKKKYSRKCYNRSGKIEGLKIIPEYELDDRAGGKKKMLDSDDSDFAPRPKPAIADENGTVLYNLNKELGNGAFSHVYDAKEEKTNLPFAVKVFDFRRNQTKEVFRTESKIMESVSHVNIVKFKQVITSDHYGYIVMELACGGDLFEKILLRKHIVEVEVLRITTMILDAVTYLHNKGIVHRDLKPENVLFYHPSDNSKIMITDFGFACSFDRDSNLQTYCGTEQYLSPEVTLKKAYTAKCDIWSVGIMVYVMLSGRQPFNGRDVKTLITTKTQTYNGEVGNNYSLF